MTHSYPEFSIENGYVFRMVHADNFRDILANGCPCVSSVRNQAQYTPVGSADIISKRKSKSVPIPPGGLLGDYVPFYFTARSQMLYNNMTGVNVPRRRPNEIILLASSIKHLISRQVVFIFTSGHALMAESKWYSDPNDLDQIDWDILRRSDFRRTDGDPGKSNRYQAELLVHRHVSTDDLLGLACFDDASRQRYEASVAKAGLKWKVIAKPEWYPR